MNGSNILENEIDSHLGAANYFNDFLNQYNDYVNRISLLSVNYFTYLTYSSNLIYVLF